MRKKRTTKKSAANANSKNGQAAKGRRRRYSSAQRAKVLDTARREGLTAAEVNKRFGVSAVTYYLWRKQARPAIREAARQLRTSGVLDMAEEIRGEVRDQIRRLIPDIVRTELNGVFSDIARPARRRKRRARSA